MAFNQQKILLAKALAALETIEAGHVELDAALAALGARGAPVAAVGAGGSAAAARGAAAAAGAAGGAAAAGRDAVAGRLRSRPPNFFCPQCGAGFVQQCSVYRHQRNFH